MIDLSHEIVCVATVYVGGGRPRIDDPHVPALRRLLRGFGEIAPLSGAHRLKAGCKLDGPCEILDRSGVVSAFVRTQSAREQVVHLLRVLSVNTQRETQDS